MSKERFLTVLIPIKDSDCESGTYTVQTLPAASASNINKIYKMTDGTYRRSWFNPASGQSGAYEYATVIDREFPYLGDPLEIYDFTYDATRMGTAPTISAQGVMRFADSGDTTLDGLWSQECHVIFNGENFYLKQVPTSGKNNEDARYRYDMDFVAERVVLEHVYFYDIVSPFITEKPVSENVTFSFYGDIVELIKRLNASLIRCGLARMTRKYVKYPHYDEWVPYLTYEQWNQVFLEYPEFTTTADLFEGGVEEAVTFVNEIGRDTDRDYNRYLHAYIFLSDDVTGDYIVSGYQCALGNDAEGNPVTSEEKLITFDKNTIHEALQQIHDTFELQYYIAKEKDGNGVFTGNTTIWVADCEHDFADWDENDGDYVRDADGLPTTESPFDYGVEDTLLSKEKTNTTQKIVTRITGVGSTDNIPWYYPNPNPDGWLRPLLKTLGEVQDEVAIDYPTGEGTTTQEMTRYEKFLKNRIGNNFQYGIIRDTKNQIEYQEAGYLTSGINPYISLDGIKAYYLINLKTYVLLTEQPSDWATNYGSYYKLVDGEYIALTSAETFEEDTYYKRDALYNEPKLTFDLSYASAGNCTKFVIQHLSGNSVVETYDSSQTYQNPTPFQAWCQNHNGRSYLTLTSLPSYKLAIGFYISSWPKSKIAHYEGYLYQSTTISSEGYFENYTDPDTGITHIFSNSSGYVASNFYEKEGLYPYAVFAVSHTQQPNYSTIIHYTYCSEAGYSLIDSNSNSIEEARKQKVTPIMRYANKQYRDKRTNVIYLCNKSEQPNPAGGGQGENRVFEANPNMQADEYMNTFVNMKLALYDDTDSWYLNNKAVLLSDYGIDSVTGEGYTPDIFDTIEFERVKYITPQPNLMPEVYIKTDGERRYYNAHNYLPLQQGTEADLDKPIGEELGDDGMGRDVIINPIYKENETDPNNKHYDFENEYLQTHPHEHIEDFDDVKPTIEGQTNSEVIIGGVPIRIDVVREFAYDLTDNDEIWENNDSDNVEGEYKHPYFFAKLAPLGFNIFDLALQDDMVISMTSGDCGACNFKIGVDENTKKNPVQIWPYDVWRGDSKTDPTKKLYSAGDLRRYINTDGLYYDKGNDGMVPITPDADAFEGGWLESISMYRRYTYTAESVQNGEVGTMKKDGNTHFEGDVVTNGHFIDSQQDTSTNSVWVALMKDTDTYGVLMPSAKPNYADEAYNVYIRPKSIADVHTSESTEEQDEENADKFVFINIKLPQVYLRRAERELSRKLVAYMNDNNYEKFNFSIKFSRIFIEENSEIDDNLNENAVLYVNFNNHTYRQYAKHYTYRMSHDVALPEINVDMNEELSVSRSFRQQQEIELRRNNSRVVAQINASVQQAQSGITKRMIDRTGDVMLPGNIYIQRSSTSIVQLGGGESGGGGGSTVVTGVQWGYF